MHEGDLRGVGGKDERAGVKQVRRVRVTGGVDFPILAAERKVVLVTVGIRE